jgi:hypothetical protein
MSHLPQDLGWPARRQRYMCWAVKKESLVWVGPTGESDILASFCGGYAAQCQLDCDAFAGVDTEENIHDLYRDLAKKRGIYYRSSAKFEDMDITQLLPPGKKNIFLKAKEVYDKQLASGGPSPVSFCADLSQDPLDRRRYSSKILTLTKNTELYSFSKRHLYTPAELEFSQGWPVFPAMSKYASCLGFEYDQLSVHQRRQLQGNSMHLAALAAALQFFLTHTVRRDHFEGFVFNGPSKSFIESQERETEEENQAAAGRGSLHPASH